MFLQELWYCSGKERIYMNPMDLLRIEFRTLEALAGKLGIPANTVYQWGKTNIPTKWIKDIEELSESRLTREQLRPDLFKKG
jgi:hypothetical protein